MARIVEPDADGLRDAVARLRADGLVAFPTETVYGLGADLHSAEAIDRLFRAKGRPADNPVIAHVLGEEDARILARFWDNRCVELAARFWPGPLTLVLPRDECVPDRATAGRPTIAVRAPRHPVARALLEAFDGPIAAPSANRSGHVSPTTAEHVAADFADLTDLPILQGGACEVGLESTVLDLSTTAARILRPGSVTARELLEVLDEVDEPEIRAQDASPGTSLRHYAPNTPAELVPTAQLLERLAELEVRAVVLCFDSAFVPSPHRAITMPEGAGMYARQLYGALREADGLGFARILIEAPPRSNDTWKAIGDRLARATNQT